ncbi:amino acid permease [Alloscardovia theropitheci]|uniref:Amino acid permease n=1 Tax=Alloscardovia theropitheci TaxID=2496842 RepID=A0A4R0QPM3_9BIFI|nr:amino acid permease [Alloscardovia theropitheci]TCD54184.1 amino acid permease [Alloscardovia theropitheci]
MTDNTDTTNSQSSSASFHSTLKTVDHLDKNNQMERGLKNRHIQFIAIGGTIGTGLFLGSGESIALTGPSIIFVYIAVGLFMFILMRAIGELMYRDPSQHTFINFIGKYVSPAWGRFAGWSYWIVLILIGMTEITAVSTYCVSFFGTFGIDISAYKWIIELVFLVILTTVNLIAVKVFGEAEFWFSMIKIALIIGLILTAAVMVIIHFHYPAQNISGTQVPAGQTAISNITDNFQLAPNGWLNFFMAFPMVFFAYELIEFVGVTVSETENPRAILPKAVNQLIYRILIFYVGALIAIMCIVPWRSFIPDAQGNIASPFIMVFRYAGIDWAAGLVFFVVITAASSALNSLLYSAGRHLYQLAQDSSDSSVLSKLKLDEISKNKVPARAIIASAVLIILSPIVSLIPAVQSAFTLFSSASSAVIIFIYVLTIIAHYNYRKSPNFTRDGFLLRGYQFFDVIGIVFFIVIYASLFASPTRVIPAIAGICWLIGFGIYCHIKEKRMSAGDGVPNGI